MPCHKNVTDAEMIFCSDLAIECFEKARRSRPLKPLQALKDFRVIYDASGKSDGKGSEKSGGHDRAKLQSQVRRARSLSPVKDSGAARGKTATTGVPKSTSMYAPQCGKEKRPPQENAGDAARQVPETTSTTRLRQGRRAKEDGGNVSSDSKDSLPAEETTKTPAQRTMQTDSTRGKTASTSAKPAINNSRQSNGSGALKEPQLQKSRASAGGDGTDDNHNLPNRGS